jgi:hypothetical protein
MKESFIASQIAPTLRLESQCEGDDARDPPLIRAAPLPHLGVTTAVEHQEGSTWPAWLKITLGS